MLELEYIREATEEEKKNGQVIKKEEDSDKPITRGNENFDTKK